jgi:hypothetical protein
MHSNRPNRNPQQVRSIIQSLGRSIDEARTRRLGPSLPNPTEPSRSMQDTRWIGLPATPERPGVAAAASFPTVTAAPAPRAELPISAPPPVRSAQEMFNDGTPRLKARPKRAS